MSWVPVKSRIALPPKPNPSSSCPEGRIHWMVLGNAVNPLLIVLRVETTMFPAGSIANPVGVVLGVESVPSFRTSLARGKARSATRSPPLHPIATGQMGRYRSQTQSPNRQKALARTTGYLNPSLVYEQNIRYPQNSDQRIRRRPIDLRQPIGRDHRHQTLGR